MTYYGIYKITNLLNGKMYIGQHTTTNIDDGYMGSGIRIQRAIKKYGKENFRKEWLMFCEDEEELNYMERVYVDQTWVDRSDTYNLNLGGDCQRHSEQTRKKISLAQKGKKEKYPSPMKGKRFSKEVRKHMSEAHKGYKQTDEHRKNISASNIGKHKQPLSIEQRMKISQTLTGRKNPEHSKKMSGRKHFNNGKISIMAYECPEGFVAGRLPFINKEGK